MLEAPLHEAGFEVVALRAFNPLAIPGWILSAKLLRLQRLNLAPLWLFNALVPAMPRLDALSRVTGLSLPACAEKPRSSPSEAW